MAAQTVDIADDTSKDNSFAGSTAVARSRLRIDARKWLASKLARRTVIPTIRKPGSEIWVTFNPELETDDTYQRFVVNPPPGSVVVKTSYEYNDYLSDELRLEIEHLKATDPDEYEYVYEGMCRQAVAGAVYKNELLAADKEGRICRVPYDASKPVDTFWDLGYFDNVARM